MLLSHDLSLRHAYSLGPPVPRASASLGLFPLPQSFQECLPLSVPLQPTLSGHHTCLHLCISALSRSVPSLGLPPPCLHLGLCLSPSKCCPNPLLCEHFPFSKAVLLLPMLPLLSAELFQLGMPATASPKFLGNIPVKLFLHKATYLQNIMTIINKQFKIGATASGP